MYASNVGIEFGKDVDRRKVKERRSSGIAHSQYKNNFTPNGEFWEERRSGLDRRDRRRGIERRKGVG